MSSEFLSPMQDITAVWLAVYSSVQEKNKMNYGKQKAKLKLAHHIKSLIFY